MKGRFVSYPQEHVLISFTSSCYDMPPVKTDLLEYLLNKIKFVILKGKSFTCLATTKLKLLDIKNYITSGFDNAKFIRAYKVEQQKFYWPYEWFQNFQQLHEPTLSSNKAFYSSLKKENISQETYTLCQTFGKRKTGPACGTILGITTIWSGAWAVFASCGKIIQCEQGSWLGRFQKQLDSPRFDPLAHVLRPATWCLLHFINQSNSDLHQLINKNVCGGLSVVFQREHQAGVMYIRQHDFGKNANLCKQILGYDANSL